MRFLPLVLLQVIIFYYIVINARKHRKPIPYEQNSPEAKFDNPNFIKDRTKDSNMSKPQMPEAWNDRNRQPFHPAWMDYCSKYHCDDYHKPACGLNRDSMKFKWFQSECHIILNNYCAYFRGLLKFDIVEVKFCYKYVMNIRTGCPRRCEGEVAPVCALDHRDRPLLFKNRCAMEMANCNNSIEKFDEVFMSVCDHFWSKK